MALEFGESHVVGEDCPGQLRQRAGGMRGEGRHCVAGGAVLLPDDTAKVLVSQLFSPFSQLENCTADKLCEEGAGDRARAKS